MISSIIVYDFLFFTLLREILCAVFNPPSLSVLAGAFKNFFKFGWFLNFLSASLSRFLFYLSKWILSRWSFIFAGFIASLLKVFSNNWHIDIVLFVNEGNLNFKYSCEYCLHFFLTLVTTIVWTRNGQI